MNFFNLRFLSILFFFFQTLSSLTSFSQSTFEMDPNKNGLLIIKKSEIDRDQIPSPPNGLILYNTTSNKLNYFNGNIWEALVPESNLTKKIACNLAITNYSTVFNPGTYSIPYDWVIDGLNVQNVFNTTQYYFEAPVTGVYQINCSMSFKLPKTGYYYISLQNAANTNSFGYDYGELLANRSTPIVLKISTTTKLTSGQKVYPKMTSNALFSIDNGAGSTFSAHLVYQ